MYLKREKNVTINLRSLWAAYSLAFSGTMETDKIANIKQFERTLLSNFPHVRRIKVSSQHVVLLDLGELSQGRFSSTPRIVMLSW